VSRPNGLSTSHLPVFPILAPSEISPSAGPDLSTSLTPCCRIGAPKGGSHYNYHPNLLIYHWTTIRGYASSGATFHFQDPAANTTVLGTAWANVAPYFSMSSASTYSFMTHNVTRGIAW